MIAEAFNAGATIDMLMDRHQVTKGTILEHLTRFVTAGNKLRNGQYLQTLSSASPAQQQAAFAAFKELSPTFLKPVFDKLNGTLNYDDLKILRMLYLIANQDTSYHQMNL
jgi:hypothetical protein